MGPVLTPAEGCAPSAEAPRLMVSGWVHLSGGAPVEVRRMMAVVGSDGAELGQAAAVVVEGPDQTATHLLLCRLTPEPEYRLAPITLVAQVDEGTIRLRLPSSAVTTLPRREAS